MTRLVVGVAAAAALLALTGCGSGHMSQAPAASTSGGGATTHATSTGGPGALQAEANATAAGDIPDNQVFLLFKNRAGSYSMKYPEGWVQQGLGPRVTFRDKNNIVRIAIRGGRAAGATQVRRDPSLRTARITAAPKAMNLNGNRAIKVVYTTQSAPNPVTGKRVTLTVDRFYIPSGGKVAIIDLGTPVGVDNVDAYRLMVESFRWR